MTNNGCKPTQNSFKLLAIFLLPLWNDQSCSHGYLLFSNDCLRKANDLQFQSHESLLLKNDSWTHEKDFPFSSHSDFTATSRLHALERLVVRNVFAWEVTFVFVFLKLKLQSTRHVMGGNFKFIYPTTCWEFWLASLMLTKMNLVSMWSAGSGLWS